MSHAENAVNVLTKEFADTSLMNWKVEGLSSLVDTSWLKSITIKFSEVMMMKYMIRNMSNIWTHWRGESSDSVYHSVTAIN